MAFRYQTDFRRAPSPQRCGPLWEELTIFAPCTAYLRKAIDEHLEGDYISSIYAGIPQLQRPISGYVSYVGGTHPELDERLPSRSTEGNGEQVPRHTVRIAIT